MKEIRIIMGMPVTVEILGQPDSLAAAMTEKVFDYFAYVDQTFSTYKKISEIEKINDGLLPENAWSEDMREIFALAQKTKEETNGYFDIVNNEGRLDPSGIVKGWAIWNASKLLTDAGAKNFYIEAGGDIQVAGLGPSGGGWKVGIKNPFNTKEIIKAVFLKHNEGIATSGNYERGAHIYNPKNRQATVADVASITVVGPNVYEADRFATAAFAMQEEGIGFIQKRQGLAAYMVDKNKMATMTNNFHQYVIL